MKDLSLSHGENIFYQGTYQSLSVAVKEIIITNKAVYDVTRGLFSSRIIKVVAIPVRDIIKDENGAPQVTVNHTLGRSDWSLVLYHSKGSKRLIFQNSTDAVEWADRIHAAIAPDGLPRVKSSCEANAGKGLMGETFGEMAQMLGIGNRKKTPFQPEPIKNRRLTKKCASCSAPITGISGTHVKCEYCGTEQKI